VAEVLPSIVKAVEQMAPSNEMFADGIRLAGLDLLSRLHIREGIPLCISVIEIDRWGAGKRLAPCLEYLSRYGSQAREVAPQLKDLRAKLAKGGRGKDNAEQLKLVDKTLAAIQSAAPAPTVVSVQEFRAKHSGSGKRAQL